MRFLASRPTPKPEAWHVQCPECSSPISCDMEEDVDGSFSVSDRDGDPCVLCEDCGVFFIPASVSIRFDKDGGDA